MYYLSGGPERAFVSEELMLIPEDTKLPPDYVQNWFLCWWIFGPRGNLESCIFQRHTYLNLTTLNMDGNIENNVPSTARKEERMSSCKRATGARSRPRTKASAATKTNPFNICPGIICSCGKMCKDSRGLKSHQAKTKCQMPENTLKAPPKNVLCH